MTSRRRSCARARARSATSTPSPSMAATTARPGHRRGARRHGSSVRAGAVVRWSAARGAGRRRRLRARADAAMVAVPATVIDAIAFDPPLPEPKLARYRGGTLRSCGEAVRRRCAAGATERRAVGARALLVLHAARRRTASRCRSSPRSRADAAALEALDVGTGPDRWVAALRRLRPDLHARRGHGARLDVGSRSLGPGRLLGTRGVRSPIRTPSSPPGRSPGVRR